MRRLTWAPRSTEDLRRIDRWLSERNDLAAARILLAIRTAALRLREFPEIGPPIDDGLRVLGVRTTPHLLVYRVLDDAVEIVRVRHNREDWTASPTGEA